MLKFITFTALIWVMAIVFYSALAFEKPISIVKSSNGFIVRGLQ